MRLWKIAPPTLSRLREAPISAIDRGRRMCLTAATAASWSRDSKRWTTSGDSEIGLCTDTNPSPAPKATGKPLSRNTPSIRVLSASTSAWNCV
jgi:hypothetical protein